MTITRINPQNFLPLSGGTITGDLLSQRSNFDLSKANNNVSSVIYPTTFSIFDSAGRISARLEDRVNPNGSNGFFLYARNYNTSGEMVTQKGIVFDIDKSGNGIWGISDPAAFRGALQITIGYGNVTCAASTGTSAKIPFRDTTRTNSDYLAFAQFSTAPPYWTELRGPVITGRAADGVTVSIWNMHTAAITIDVWVVGIG